MLWSSDELETHQRRMERLTKEGLTEVEAAHLATEMLYRDRPVSGDDRRLCLECRGLQKGRCKHGQPVLLVLQRCDWFSLRGGAS